MKKDNRIRFICNSAIVAALYFVLTYLTNIFGLASGPIQCRLSEAMCVLPSFIPSAGPGLFAGCLLSNVFTGCNVFDIVFGSIATLVGAYGTHFLSKRSVTHFLYPVPTIIANTVIIPFVLKYTYGFEGGLLYFFLTVGAGEIISCGILGIVLYYSLKKSGKFLHD